MSLSGYGRLASITSLSGDRKRKRHSIDFTPNSYPNTHSFRAQKNSKLFPVVRHYSLIQEHSRKKQ